MALRDASNNNEQQSVDENIKTHHNQHYPNLNLTWGEIPVGFGGNYVTKLNNERKSCLRCMSITTDNHYTDTVYDSIWYGIIMEAAQKKLAPKNKNPLT